MVAGDHHCPYAGIAAFLDGTYDFLPFRIYHSCHSDEDEILLHIFHFGRDFICRPVCHCKHPQRGIRHCLVPFLQVCNVIVRYCAYPIRRLDSGAYRKYLIQPAFGIDLQGAVRHPVDGGHPFPR